MCVVAVQVCHCACVMLCECVVVSVYVPDFIPYKQLLICKFLFWLLDTRSKSVTYFVSNCKGSKKTAEVTFHDLTSILHSSYLKSIGGNL